MSGLIVCARCGEYKPTRPVYLCVECQERDAEIERLRVLLYRCQVAWVEDDSDLAAEVRAALEGK